MAGHRVCDPEARARGPLWFREVPATRAPWETPGGAQGEPAAEGRGGGPVSELEPGRPTMLHKWQLLWLTSRPTGSPTWRRAPDGTVRSAFWFWPEQRGDPTPWRRRLKASHGVTLASTCWASPWGCGGCSGSGAGPCAPARGLAQQGPQEPRVWRGGAERASGRPPGSL